MPVTTLTKGFDVTAEHLGGASLAIWLRLHDTPWSRVSCVELGYRFPYSTLDVFDERLDNDAWRRSLTHRVFLLEKEGVGVAIASIIPTGADVSAVPQHACGEVRIACTAVRSIEVLR
ncbi:hypothetical protein [Mycobacteroides abscessus]|uniref:hypothetical protein n=1 Tax=Mycobacteroides abscessus TaxID=36809 RepID=UPI0012FFF78D|nr:hypothetical protein [Mycobacteroides abscessus]